ncbi:hypothetical protein ACJJTC_016173 [Scirpophaga incertulas]
MFEIDQLTGRIIILITLVAVPFQAITVSPLCPTNKIAPHRRIGSWQRPNSRTLGAYYDLLSPNFSQASFQNQEGLQEQPQQDDPNDCGEIEDYDENDLSTLTLAQRKQERDDSRFFFGGLFHRPPQQLPPYQRPTRPPTTTNRPLTRPPRPQSNYPPQRPPYWSGGPFAGNHYHAPTYQSPSDNFKPVHEAGDYSDVLQTYRPSLVGAPLGHVVGLPQAKPTTPATYENMRRRPNHNNMQLAQGTFNPTKRPRSRNFNNNSIIGSFIDLLFK